MANEHTKEVNYFKYCRLCKHHGKREDEDPCNKCLTQGYNFDSKKPIRFEEA